MINPNKSPQNSDSFSTENMPIMWEFFVKIIIDKLILVKIISNLRPDAECMRITEPTAKIKKR